MPLLLGTDIDKQINDKIKGKVARVGGHGRTVDTVQELL
jgi:hypothetical protein